MYVCRIFTIKLQATTEKIETHIFYSLTFIILYSSIDVSISKEKWNKPFHFIENKKREKETESGRGKRNENFLPDCRAPLKELNSGRNFSGFNFSLMPSFISNIVVHCLPMNQEVNE
jgi:hypothetical protein